MMSHSHIPPYLHSHVLSRGQYANGYRDTSQFMSDGSSRRYNGVPPVNMGLLPSIRGNVNASLNIAPQVRHPPELGENFPNISLRQQELSNYNTYTSAAISNNITSNNNVSSSIVQSMSKNPLSMELHDARATHLYNASLKGNKATGSASTVRHTSKVNARFGQERPPKLHNAKYGKLRLKNSFSNRRHKPSYNAASRRPVSRAKVMIGQDKFNQGVDIYSPWLLNEEGNEISRQRVTEIYKELQQLKFLKDVAGPTAASDGTNMKVLLLNDLLPSSSIRSKPLVQDYADNSVKMEEMSEISDDSEVESLLEMETASEPSGSSVGKGAVAMGVSASGSMRNAVALENEGANVVGNRFVEPANRALGATTTTVDIRNSQQQQVDNRVAAHTWFNTFGEGQSTPFTTDFAAAVTAPLPAISVASAEPLPALFRESKNDVSSNTAFSYADAAEGSLDPMDMEIDEVPDMPRHAASVSREVAPVVVEAAAVPLTAASVSLETALVSVEGTGSDMPTAGSFEPKPPSPITLRLKDEKKLVLVLDLDNTLLHSFPRNKMDCEIELKDFLDSNGHPELYKFTLGLAPEYDYYLKLRPHVREFLETLSSCFELSIYTNATSDYADAVLATLDPDRKYFGDRVAARKERSNAAELKSIKRLYPDIDKRYVLLFDDRADVWIDLPSEQIVRAEHYQFLIYNQANLSKYYVANGGDVSSNFQVQEPVYDYDEHLPFMANVFLDVHKKFFEQLEINDNADVGNILETYRLSVLEGVGLCFTGFLKGGSPTENAMAESEYWHRISSRRFGAAIYSQFDEPGVTHIVALRSTTENFKKWKEAPCDRIKRVHPLWLYDCFGTWQRSDESLFDADELCNTLKQKATSSPQHDHWAYRWKGVAPRKVSSSSNAGLPFNSRSSGGASLEATLPRRYFSGTGDYSNGSFVISPFERIDIGWSANSNTLGQNQNYLITEPNTERYTKPLEYRLSMRPPLSTLVPPPYTSTTSSGRLGSGTNKDVQYASTMIDSFDRTIPNASSTVLYPSLAASGMTAASSLDIGSSNAFAAPNVLTKPNPMSASIFTASSDSHLFSNTYLTERLQPLEKLGGTSTGRSSDMGVADALNVETVMASGSPATSILNTSLS